MSSDINDILLKMIRWVDLFETIPDNELLELAQKFTLKFYQAWTPIIKEWTRPDKIYILKNWLLEAKKAERVLGEINPGEIFWEMSYLRWSNAMASIVASQDSDVWEIMIDDFSNFLWSYPEIMDKVYEKMKERENQNRNNALKFYDADNDFQVNI